MNLLTKAGIWLSQLGSGAQLLTGRQDQDNFVTNRVSLQELTDSPSTALNLSTVWACVRLHSSLLGSLPWQIVQRGSNGIDQEAIDHPLWNILGVSPNADQTPMDLFEFLSASFELQGNAYSPIVRGSDGRVIALGEPIVPDAMQVTRTESGAIQYRTTVGKERTWRQEDMLHVRGFGGTPLGGLSTIQFAARSLGLSTSIERSAAAVFRNGVRSTGVMSIDKALSKEQRETAEELLVQKYVGAMNDGRPLLLDNGVKWQSLSINPDDAQMLESRAFSVEEVCRWFGVPPHMIGHTSKSTSWGTGLEQQTLAFVIYALRGRVKKFEQALSKQLLSPEDRAKGIRLKMDLRSLLRGDSKARSELYQSALQNGWMTINEVRALEGMAPVPGGDEPRMQAQNIPITQAGTVAPTENDDENSDEE